MSPMANFCCHLPASLVNLQGPTLVSHLASSFLVQFLQINCRLRSLTDHTNHSSENQLRMDDTVIFFTLNQRRLMTDSP